MIISITCRHGTEDKKFRHHVASELILLLRCMSTITRIQVVFSKETHHKKNGDLVTCHLSIHVPNKNQIDIYEHWPNKNMAFDWAQERAVSTLSRLASCNSKFIKESYDV